MRRAEEFVLLLLLAGGMTAGAQAPGVEAQAKPAPATVTNGYGYVEDPVSEVRKERSWEYGPFVNWGTGLGNRSDYKFLWGGFELGKVMTPVIHAGFLSGQFQLAGNIMPLWQAYTPPPHEENYTCITPGGQPIGCLLPTGGGTFYGVSLTPVIFRWNLATRSRR
ncbi:MAG: hypothetical protein WBC92_17125, partial [Terracidiphilus sp.]